MSPRALLTFPVNKSTPFSSLNHAALHAPRDGWALAEVGRTEERRLGGDFVDGGGGGGGVGVIGCWVYKILL